MNGSRGSCPKNRAPSDGQPRPGKNCSGDPQLPNGFSLVGKHTRKIPEFAEKESRHHDTQCAAVGSVRTGSESTRNDRQISGAWLE